MDRLEAVAAQDAETVSRFGAERGYVWLRGLVEPELLRSLAAVVDAAWAAAPGDLPALHCAVLPTPELEAVRGHARLRSALRTLLGECRPDHGDVVRYVLPGDPPTPPHQDAHYVGLQPSRWVAWIPLDDCPRSSGPLTLWPGSHRLGLLDHDSQGLASAAAAGAKWVSADLSRGDAILFDARTVHKSLPNRTLKPRCSVDFRYAEGS